MCCCKVSVAVIGDAALARLPLEVNEDSIRSAWFLDPARSR